MANLEGNNFLKRYKNDRFFKPFDLIIYIVIALIVALSIISLIALTKTTDTDGFKVVKNGQEVFSYTYKNGILINADFKDNVSVNLDGTITVTFDGKHNTLKFNDDEKWVQVIDANCKTQDCITAGKLKSNGVILCLHNNVKILPLSDNDSLIIGGIL